MHIPPQLKDDEDSFECSDAQQKLQKSQGNISQNGYQTQIVISEQNDSKIFNKRKSQYDFIPVQQKYVKMTEIQNTNSPYLEKSAALQDEVKIPSQSQNFFYHFLKFYALAISVPQDKIKFKYINELFNIEIQLFPSDEEIYDIQMQLSPGSTYQVSKMKKNWNDEDKKVLIWIIGKLSAMKALDLKNITDADWDMISQQMSRRDRFQCKQKWLQMLKIPLQQAPWTNEEDDILLKLIIKFQENQKGNKWSLIAQQLNIITNSNVHRNGKQCRERWNNFLNPTLNRKPWNDTEDVLLLKSVLHNGKKWALISKILEIQRSENAVKNRFNCLLKKERNLVAKQENLQEKAQIDDASQDSFLQSIPEELLEDDIRSIQSLIYKLDWRISQQQSMTDVQYEKIKQYQENVSQNLEQSQQNSNLLRFKSSSSMVDEQKKQITNLSESMGSINLGLRQSQISFYQDKIENMNMEDVLMTQCCLINHKKETIYYLSPEQMIEFLDYQRKQLIHITGQTTIQNSGVGEELFINFQSQSLHTIEEQQSFKESSKSVGKYLQLKGGTNPSINSFICESAKSIPQEMYVNEQQNLMAQFLNNQSQHNDRLQSILQTQSINSQQFQSMVYPQMISGYGPTYSNQMYNPYLTSQLTNNLLPVQFEQIINQQLTDQNINLSQTLSTQQLISSNGMSDNQRRASYKIRSLSNFADV